MTRAARSPLASELVRATLDGRRDAASLARSVRRPPPRSTVLPSGVVAVDLSDDLDDAAELAHAALLRAEPVDDDTRADLVARLLSAAALAAAGARDAGDDDRHAWTHDAAALTARAHHLLKDHRR